MKNSVIYEAPSTSRLAIVHDFKLLGKWQDHVQFGQTTFAQRIQETLDPKTLIVEMHHTIEDIERIFNIQGFGASLLLGIKSLVGKTLVYHNGHIHIQESGTKVPVRPVMAANDENFAIAA